MDGRGLYESARDKVALHRLPNPTRPKAGEPQYTFPQSPGNLTSEQLGAMMLRLAGYLGYLLVKQGEVEAELIGVDAQFDTNIAALIPAIRAEHGRLNKEEVRALAVNADIDLRKLYERLTELRSVEAILRGKIAAYTQHFQALSREQSRRDTEARAS
jgi:hypothetical protein